MTTDLGDAHGFSRLSLLLMSRLPEWDKRTYGKIAKKLGVNDGTDLLLISQGRALLDFYKVPAFSKGLDIDLIALLKAMAEQDWDDQEAIKELADRTLHSYEPELIQAIREWKGEGNRADYQVTPDDTFVIMRRPSN